MPDSATERPSAVEGASTAVAPPTTIVGVGASAGGVKALQSFFESLPADMGAAFVVIVHLDPSTRSELAEILGTRSKMPVHQVTHNMALKPDCIYVIPPDRQLRISNDEIAAVPFEEPRGQRTPIDLFFRSLAEQHGDGFAVILTGAGSDGAIGVKAVKEAGGIILVQDPEEAEHSSMPRAAIATQAVDFVLPVKDLAVQLAKLVEVKRQMPDLGAAGGEEEMLGRILSHLRVRTGHDFSNYKRSTVLRRIQRRMQVTHTGILEDYFRHTRENPEEAQALLGDLLISVTTFFRDPKVFDALARKVVRQLFANEDESGAIRAWVVGCATGEEAYTIAMLLLEQASRHQSRPDIQIFATDMDSRALAIEREGRYPIAIEADLGEDRLHRFFQRDGDHYKVKRELRDIVLFANHSLLKDPPFSHLDLISCRNLLIYLNRDLQQQAIATFHYSLNPNGFLLLGASEVAEHPQNLFRALDRVARIYQSTGRSGGQRIPVPSLRGAGPSGEPRLMDYNRSFTSQTAIRVAHRQALETAAPPSVVVDSSYRVLHLSENAGRYMQPPAGPLSGDLTDLVREEIRFELRAALFRCFETGKTVLTPPLPVRFNGAPHTVYVQIKPVGVSKSEETVARALVLFIEDETESVVPSIAGNGAAEDDVVTRLRHELETAHAAIRAAREESDRTTEEFRAANEELQSANEEHRSTAEELETSKEELQSINEELQTVNSELKLKLDAVSRANSDLQNLFAATDFGILFLDSELRIQRFTPQICDLFNITNGDAGRPITDFTHRLEYADIAATARKVLADPLPVGREVQGPNDSWYLVRFRPYRTVQDKIDGVVITILDITERRRTEDALRASEQNLRDQIRLVELSRSPMFIWDFEGGIRQWNRGCEQLYGYREDEAIGKSKHELLKTRVPGSSFDAVRKELLGKGFWRGELEHTAKDGKILQLDASLDFIQVSGGRYVLESTRDITHNKMLEDRQRLLLRELTHRVKNILAVVQGLVHQTGRTTAAKDDFTRRLDGRLATLASAHALLVESDWKGADLRELVEGQLTAYVSDGKRLRIEGERVALAADVATPFGLVVHELATNAMKYGALSNENGRIDVSWSLKARNNERRLKFTWREENGPPVKKPSSDGFGAQLIRHGLPGATVKHEFLPGGVQCTIEFSPAENAQNEPAGTNFQ